MPSRNHGIVQANLIAELARHKQFRIVSELTLELEDGLFTPDITVYRRAPVDFRTDEVRLTDPPLVAVEILSPTQGYQEVMDKARIYLRRGVQSCWVVNPPQRAVTIFLPDASQKSFVEGQVHDSATGLTVSLDAIFA